MKGQMFRIDGFIEAPSGGVNSDDLFYKFIMWIEENELKFGGRFNECNEDGTPINTAYGNLWRDNDGEEHKE